jgi:hypothetical protein
MDKVQRDQANANIPTSTSASGDLAAKTVDTTMIGGSVIKQAGQTATNLQENALPVAQSAYPAVMETAQTVSPTAPNAGSYVCQSTRSVGSSLLRADKASHGTRLSAEGKEEKHNVSCEDKACAGACAFRSDPLGNDLQKQLDSGLDADIPKRPTGSATDISVVSSSFGHRSSDIGHGLSSDVHAISLENRINSTTSTSDVHGVAYDLTLGRPLDQSDRPAFGTIDSTLDTSNSSNAQLPGSGDQWACLVPLIFR